MIATLTTYNCESDDICPESTLTTPRMIITFYDVNNPEERKNVESLGVYICLLYTSPSPRDGLLSRMPSSA